LGDDFEMLKQHLNYTIPEGLIRTNNFSKLSGSTGMRIQAIKRIQILDPAKLLPEEQEIAQHWADLQNASLASDLYERGLTEQWRKIGCAAYGAPYVLSKLSEMLANNLSPFASNSAQIPQLAADFLKEDCAGMRGVSEETKTQLRALRDKVP